jgi:uncharacterized membrane protein
MQALPKYLATYAATTIVMLLLDLLWLGVIAAPLYQQGLSHLMAEQPNLIAAAIFYALFPVGLMLFAVLPQAMQPHWPKALAMAAAFGFFCYATYDLTNLATLRQWPLSLSLLDMAWGSTVSMAAAAAGRATWRHLTHKPG